MKRHNAIVYSLGLSIALGSVPFVAHTQAIPTLSIIFPNNESIVQPGQTLQVSIAATNSSQLLAEAIVGTQPLDASLIQAPDAQQVLNLDIPNDIAPGRYYVTAIGLLKAGGTCQSAAVSIFVPVTGTLTALSVRNNPLVLRAPGVQIPLDVTGVVNANNLTMSPTFLAFVSSNPSIASVDANGVVTGQGPGQTQITVSYSGSTNISTTINVQVLGGKRGDLNGDGQIDIADINILTSLLNTPAAGPNDSHDVNHDGVVNALDSRILVTLCTYPRCATHP